ncbi:hypothetical protein AVEN_46036-1 [Araneus ventricosus]|uniref:Uncharacterized protein n=1 Tax=Araneus ventricosus TaxID=182803 RepID=A0A4Y2X437_ARAVE|nr:hypothetical protein AVEN_46036-1 [Araneus ventricosus]
MKSFTVELALLSLKMYEMEEKVNYKVVELHRFSTKRHLMVMNAKNRTLKMHICLFAASETVASRSPDLTPMDFFLWGYLKQVYATPPPAL